MEPATVVDMLQEQNSDSVDNPDRRELLWEAREEQLFSNWRKTCNLRSDLHNKAAKKNKFYYRIFGVLTVTIPIIMSGIIKIDKDPNFNVFAFITTGILNAIQGFFNFGRVYAEHNEFSARYEDFKREMDTELVKPKAHRVACDVFLRECEMKMNALTRQAPDL